ncbi:MAG: UvrB/UvrC motif-containing protein [bacterium]|nr:UvrB/UvrC motif-containing protein [bacterium]
MKKDFLPILKEWAFDPEDICTRKIVGEDGREKLQVRLDLGLIQMEVTGRPDGTRPHGYESALDCYLDRLETYRAEHGTDEGFNLDEDACRELWLEGLQYYQRYISLLRLEDFEGVLRDTAHTLAVFDLVKTYSDDEEVQLCFEQYRPYVTMIHARSKGEICLLSDDYEGALEVVQEGIDEIRDFLEACGDPEEVTESEELQALEAWMEEVRRDRPQGLKQQLSQQMQDAISQEHYERAALLRDRLRGMD